jgi:hypothetical protein
MNADYDIESKTISSNFYYVSIEHSEEKVG